VVGVCLCVLQSYVIDLLLDDYKVETVSDVCDAGTGTASEQSASVSRNILDV